MRLLALMIIPAILIVSFAFGAVWVPLPRPFPPSMSNARNLVAAVGTGVLGMGYVAGMGIYAVVSFRESGRVLDPVFTSLGLRPQSHMFFGRRYRGQVEGREIDVDYMPSQVGRPSLLNVYVEADVDTRMAIGTQRPLLDCTNCLPVDADGKDLDHLHILARDETWAQGLLGQNGNGDVLLRLMHDQETLGTREVYFQPDRIWLRAHPTAQAREADLRQWFDGAMALAQAAEGIE